MITFKWNYQKALNNINSRVWNQDMETTEYVATLQDALEKQIEEKVQDSEELYLGRSRFYPYECPRCQCGMTGDLKYNYCPNCGQKLRW